MYISSSLKFLMICCLFFLRVHTAIGQSNETQRIVTGIVIDNAGSAITNVSVKLKESLLEVKSNEKGFFSIKLP